MALIYNDDPDRLLDFVYLDLRGETDLELYREHHPFFDPNVFSFRQYIPKVGWKTSKPNNKINVAWTTEFFDDEVKEATKGMYVITSSIPIKHASDAARHCFFPWHLTETARNNVKILSDFKKERRFFANALFGGNKSQRVDLYQQLCTAGLDTKCLINLIANSKFGKKDQISFRSPELDQLEHTIIKNTMSKDQQCWDSLEHIEIKVLHPITGRPVPKLIPASQFIPRAIFENSWYSIVSETDQTNFDYFFPTEKIAKALASSKIFFVSGCRDFLPYLRKMGFQTFNKIINENYSELRCYHARNKEMVNELKKLETEDPDRMYQQAEDILHHNQELLYSDKLFRSVRNFLTDLRQLAD